MQQNMRTSDRSIAKVKVGFLTRPMGSLRSLPSHLLQIEACLSISSAHVLLGTMLGGLLQNQASICQSEIWLPLARLDLSIFADFVILQLSLLATYNDYLPTALR